MDTGIPYSLPFIIIYIASCIRNCVVSAYRGAINSIYYFMCLEPHNLVYAIAKLFE